jgi:hypothetical protein
MSKALEMHWGLTCHSEGEVGAASSRPLLDTEQNRGEVVDEAGGFNETQRMVKKIRQMITLIECVETIRKKHCNAP